MSLEEASSELWGDAEIALWAAERLAAAVMARAVEDAIYPSPIYQRENRDNIQAEARAWLTSTEGLYYAEMAGYSPDVVVQWVNAGCPKADPKVLKALNVEQARIRDLRRYYEQQEDAKP